MRWSDIIAVICLAAVPVFALDYHDAREVRVHGETIVVNNMVESDRIIIDALYPAPPAIKKKIYHISFDAISCRKVYSDGRVSGWEIKLPAGIRRFVDYFLIDIDASRGFSWARVY